MEPRAPDDMIDLAGAGTPSFAADITARSDGAFVAYGSRSSVWIAEVDGARGAPKELKLSEDGSVFQVREGAPPFPLLRPSCLTSTPRSQRLYLHVGLLTCGPCASGAVAELGWEREIGRGSGALGAGFVREWTPPGAFPGAYNLALHLPLP
eukprot:COSAG06_NODE_28673_length_570_cov_0.685775_1_plen_151_part_10